MKRRQIDEKMVRDVLKNPHQQVPSKEGKEVIQGKYLNHSQQQEMLLRMIGKRRGDTFHIITAYKTSKIKKYWMEEG